MLFIQILDQIHQQPMPISISIVSLPAPESVVDSFPVKIHRNSEKSESADDVSQYVFSCLLQYAYHGKMGKGDISRNGK